MDEGYEQAGRKKGSLMMEMVMKKEEGRWLELKWGGRGMGGTRGGFGKEETNMMNKLDTCRIIRYPCNACNGIVIGGIFVWRPVVW